MMRSSHIQRGVSLLEVLIALVILTIGVLGTISLETNGIRFADSSWIRSNAVGFIDTMAERMRVNPQGVLAGDYDRITGPVAVAPPACDGSVCTPDQVAQYDAAQWESEIAASLPGGYGQVSYVSNGSPRIYRITVLWGEPGAPPAANAACPYDTTKYCLSAQVRPLSGR